MYENLQKKARSTLCIPAEVTTHADSCRVLLRIDGVTKSTRGKFYAQPGREGHELTTNNENDALAPR